MRERAMRLTVESARDRLGRCTFCLDWQQDGRKRGQYFFAVPEEHIRRLKANGWHVILTADTSQAA